MLKKYSNVMGAIATAVLLLTACASAAETPPTAAPTSAATTAPAAQAEATSTTAATATTAVSPTAAVTETTAATIAATSVATAAATSQSGAGAGAPASSLTSMVASAAPKLDGVADDAVWKDAPGVKIQTAGGMNSSNTTVMVQSVYDAENVYFLLTWADPTQSFIRQPWEKQADGTWKLLISPENKGGDENKFYEDKLAMIWPIKNSIKNFDTQGCFTGCHAGENPDKKPFGNKYTNSPEETGDIWHWKSVRNVGQVDDQFLDNTKYSADTPEAGRKSDKKDSGGYVTNESADKKMPGFMPPNGGDKTGAPGFINDAEKVAFDDSQFKAGDRVPAIITAPFTGDRGDISAGWKYANGKWTLEMSRALTTGSETDVQFDDLSKTYYFGVAIFDNVQVRHGFQSGATPFVFIQP